MEAMSVINITQEGAVKFLQSIIYRFGVPRWVLIDNMTQFKGAKFVRCYTAIISSTSSAERVGRTGKRAYSVRDEDKDVL
jgi:hypothetical protein